MAQRHVAYWCLCLTLGLAGAGAAVRAAPHEGEPTARYVNPPDSPKRTNIITRLPVMIARFIRHGVSSQTRDRSHVLAPAAVASQLRTADGFDSVTWIGHMTTLLRLDGRTILTDPWWAKYASPVPGLGPRRYVPPAIAIEDLPPIDIVIVSHAHYDHLDLRAIAALPDRERITAVVPLGVGKYFRDRGYGRVVELDWDQSTVAHGVRITALPAIHWSQRTLFKKNDTLWAAFAIEARGGARVYFGGDSDRGPVHMRAARNAPEFDIALLSIGGFHNDGVHCEPEECAALGREVGARVLVPLHWGTIYLAEGPPHELPARFVRGALAEGTAADDVWVMRIGETRRLPKARGAVPSTMTVLDRSP